MVEEWQDIERFSGIYQVSNLGRVRSFKVKPSGKLLRPGATSRGYMSVGLYENGKQRSMTVHRLVLEAFVGPSHLEVNHKDGDKCNNHIENLEYATSKDNALHACRVLGLHTGERNGKAKLTAAKVLAIVEKINSRQHHKEIAAEFEISPRTIWSIAKGEYWSAVTGIERWRN